MHVVNEICSGISFLHGNYVKGQVIETHSALFQSRGKMLGGVLAFPPGLSCCLADDLRGACAAMREND